MWHSFFEKEYVFHPFTEEMGKSFYRQMFFTQQELSGVRYEYLGRWNEQAQVTKDLDIWPSGISEANMTELDITLHIFLCYPFIAA